jgi:hypothetical protein
MPIVDILTGILAAFVVDRRTIPGRIREMKGPRKIQGLFLCRWQET